MIFLLANVGNFFWKIVDPHVYYYKRKDDATLSEPFALILRWLEGKDIEQANHRSKQT